jgi:hypothetical protein
MESDDYGRRDRTSRAPRLGQKFGDGFYGVIGKACDHVGQIGFVVDGSETAVFDQGEEMSEAGAGIGMAGLQPVFGTDFERANCFRLLSAADGQNNSAVHFSVIDSTGPLPSRAEPPDGNDKPFPREVDKPVSVLS